MEGNVFLFDIVKYTFLSSSYSYCDLFLYSNRCKSIYRILRDNPCPNPHYKKRKGKTENWQIQLPPGKWARCSRKVSISCLASYIRHVWIQNREWKLHGTKILDTATSNNITMMAICIQPFESFEKSTITIYLCQKLICKQLASLFLILRMFVSSTSISPFRYYLVYVYAV